MTEKEKHILAAIRECGRYDYREMDELASLLESEDSKAEAHDIIIRRYRQEERENDLL